jgi:hypothetical protein
MNTSPPLDTWIIKNKKRMAHELQGTSWVFNDTGTEIIVNSRTKFILSTTFPFKCPQLMIHDTNHLELCKQNFIKYWKFSRMFRIEIPCVCCSSITTSYNWSPYYTCKDIYQEYMVYKKKIYYLYILQQLYKHIPDLIIKEISCYLL